MPAVSPSNGRTDLPRGVGGVNLPKSLGDRSSDEIELGDLLDPLLGVSELLLGQQPLEDAARRREADDHGIARLGNFLAEDPFA